MYSDIELRETQFINIGFGLADSNPVRRTTGEQARLLNQKIDQCANVIVRTDRLQRAAGREVPMSSTAPSLPSIGPLVPMPPSIQQRAKARGPTPCRSPGAPCVKTQTLNLRVEFPTRFRRCGDQSQW